MPDVVMASNAMQILIVWYPVRRNLAHKFPVALQAIRVQYVGVPRLNSDRVVEGPVGECDGMMVTVARFRHPLREKIVRHVTVVAGRKGMMACLLPTVEVLAHYVAVDAHLWIIRDVGCGATGIKGVSAHTQKYADQYMEQSHHIHRAHYRGLPCRSHHRTDRNPKLIGPDKLSCFRFLWNNPDLLRICKCMRANAAFFSSGGQVRVRKTFFWLHLVCGVIIGIVVFIMSVTGVALTYQKQITAWADKRLYGIQASADAVPLSTESLLAKFQEAKPSLHPSAVTLSSDPEMPAAVVTGPNETYFVNPYTGAVLGAGSHGVRTFFKVMTDWHRWLSLSGENRTIGRALTGACNAAFLLLALTGLYLWWPQKWTKAILRSLSWFRLGIRGKARDSNWHFVFGFWSLIPLIIIIVSGIVISYPWASNLVFQLAGSKAPAQMGPGGRRSGPPPGVRRPPMQIPGVDMLVKSAQAHAEDWKTISFQPPTAADKTAAFTVDRGLGGKPQLRSTLTLDRASGQILRAEKFEHLDSGMRARLWMRFVHTGEYYGLVGQTIAGIASAAGVLLVWTGLALTCRRYVAWVKRRAEA
jgi:uncharacterized iron-regulated membrane protein